MKKLIALLLALVMILGLAACGGSKAPAADAPAANAPAADAPAANAPAEAPKLDFPKKDITIVVPYDAGGGNDIYGRIVAKVAMEKGYLNGVNVIVENQPGGGGAIGQAYVAKTAPADGYTILAYSASAITNPVLKDVPFTAADFKIIVCANQDPVVLCAGPNAPFDDLAGLVEYLKTNRVIVADSGFGTSSHIRTLDWTKKLGEAEGFEIQYDCTHVDSGAIVVSDLMGGHADLTCLTVGECADAILNGNLKGIALMANDRFEGLPELPTFKELGYENFIDGADRALAVSSQVPDDVYNYLVEQFTALCSSEEFITAMKEANLNPACQSAEEYQLFIDRKTELLNSLKDYLLAGE